MKRFASTMQTDVTVQVRNRLYIIGPAIAVLMALLLGQVASQSDFYRAIPTLLLIVTGGTTLLYVAGLILFEKDEGTLNGLIVSPLRTWEYLTSKVVTLTVLALLESLILVGIVTRLQGFNIPLLVLGILFIGIIYTLIGIVMIVRFRSITDFLVPVIVISLILQMPFLYFLGLLENQLFLLIPTSAPTLLMQGAWQTLTLWEWVYALGYTLVTTVVLCVWAYRAFYRYIILKVR